MIPSYKDCVDICNKSDNFYQKTLTIDGQKVDIFNYRLNSAKEFREHNAYELRGITFVNETECFPALNKFFNLGECDGWMEEDLGDDFFVEDKLDGSMITFVKINGKYYAKTKNSFTNEQAKLAQEYFDAHPEYAEQHERFPHLQFIFELVGPSNKIVCDYPNNKLEGTQIRYKDNGEYTPLTDCPKKIELVTLKEQVKTVESIEGWILTNKQGKKFKLKTQWYLDRHGLVTETLVRENKIIELILNDRADDALSILTKSDFRRVYCERLMIELTKYLKQSTEEVTAMLSNYNGDRKEFALRYKEENLFGIAVTSLDNQDEDIILHKIKQMVLKRTKDLNKAKQFFNDELKFGEFIHVSE